LARVANLSDRNVDVREEGDDTGSDEVGTATVISDMLPSCRDLEKLAADLRRFTQIRKLITSVLPCYFQICGYQRRSAANYGHFKCLSRLRKSTD